jgi:hypothetical protein
MESKYNELLKEYPKSVPIKAAAVELGSSEMYIRLGLRAQRLPFGTAVQGERGQWCYNIPTLLFIKYLEGKWLSDMFKKGDASITVIEAETDSDFIGVS